MITATFIYTILACSNNFGVKLDNSMTLPGNKSYMSTTKCELHYDKEMKWARGYLESKLHLQNSVCGDFVYGCNDEYLIDVDVKIFATIKKCRVMNVETRVQPDNNRVFIPLLNEKIKFKLQQEIDAAVNYLPDFLEACY